MILKRKNTKKTRQVRLMEGQDDTSFRRSRTLQGTSSFGIRAISKQKTQLKSERLKKQYRRRRKQLVTSGFFSLITVAIGVYYLVSQYSSEVTSVSFSPNTTQSPPADVYKKVISQYLAVRPAEHFRFALNERNLSQFVAGKLSEVKQVQSSGEGGFKVELRRPVASWRSTNHQSFVDKEGSSFTNNYYSEPQVVVVDNSGVSIAKGGKAIVSERFLRFLGRLVSILDNSGVGKVSEAMLPKGMAREIDIKLDSHPYTIKTHINRDPAATTEDIKRVVAYLDQRKLSPGYIDVRVVGRAFYK